MYLQTVQRAALKGEPAWEGLPFHNARSKELYMTSYVHALLRAPPVTNRRYDAMIYGALYRGHKYIGPDGPGMVVSEDLLQLRRSESSEYGSTR